MTPYNKPESLKNPLKTNRKWYLTITLKPYNNFKNLTIKTFRNQWETVNCKVCQVNCKVFKLSLQKSLNTIIKPIEMRPYNNSKNLTINSKNLTIKSLKSFKNQWKINGIQRIVRLVKLIVRFPNHYYKNHSKPL